MADYYNSTRGPLALTLHGGKSLVMPPKTWIFIEPMNENSSSIVSMLKKGFLVKSKVPLTFPPESAAAKTAAAPVVTKSEVAPAAAEGKAEASPAAEEKTSESTSYFKKKR